LSALFEWAATQSQQAASSQPDLFAAPVAPPLEEDLKDDNAQTSFGALPAVHPPHVRYARRQWERDNLGISFTKADELDVLVSTLEASGALGSRLTSTASIDATHADTTIHTVGLLHNISLLAGKDGETLAIGHIEDTTGSIELMAFPPNYKRHIDLWAENTLVAVTAHVEIHPEGDIYLLSEQLAPFTAGATEEAFNITLKAKTPRAAKELPPPKPAQPLYPSRPDLKIIPPPPPETVRVTTPPMPTGSAAYSIIISIPDANEDQTVIDSLIDLKRLLEQHPGSDNVTIRIPYLKGKWTSANLSRGVRYSHQLETQLSRLLGPDSIAVIQLAS
ncbi:MAG: OB-fold nucleic acid binding domain-containing protein, partial [Chloroflexia bacterium]